jgi:hypothetical protein
MSRNILLKENDKQKNTSPWLTCAYLRDESISHISCWKLSPILHDDIWGAACAGKQFRTRDVLRTI